MDRTADHSRNRLSFTVAAPVVQSGLATRGTAVPPAQTYVRPTAPQAHRKTQRIRRRAAAEAWAGSMSGRPYPIRLTDRTAGRLRVLSRIWFRVTSHLAFASIT